MTHAETPLRSCVESPIRVLIVDNVDDDADGSEASLRQRFRDQIVVTRMTTLAAAIRRLIEQQFDVILLELALPDSNGLATLAGIRGAAPITPLVVYARQIDDGLALQSLRAGAQECRSKAETPPAMLGRTLQFAIERHRRLTSLEAARVEAAHRATHDPLTGLANRHLFIDQLDRALAFGVRYGRKTAILFVDLDGFKGINDVHGHARGDLLLKVVSGRLSECVRRSDGVARLGGDEFVILLPDVTSRRDVSHVREAVLTCLREPIDVGGGQSMTVHASVGGAMSPLDGQTAQELLDAADADMYRDKSSRRRGREWTPDAGVPAVSDVIARLQLGAISSETTMHRREARMRAAVRNGEFEVVFQPIVDAVADRIIAAEALLRWRDPDRGLLAPASFLSLAEDTGLIVPIGEWVMRMACASVVRWRALGIAPALRVCVNVSAVQLREREFARRVETILHETACPADALRLELTERSLLVDGEIALESLRDLKALGPRLIVDDFGVGHASLTFVRDAPVDGIKLDRRFIANLLSDSRDDAIVSAMIHLAQGLNLDVTAEGVEHADQMARLVHLECAVQQGVFFSGALSAADFEARLVRAPEAEDKQRPIHVAVDRALPPSLFNGACRDRTDDPRLAKAVLSQLS